MWPAATFGGAWHPAAYVASDTSVQQSYVYSVMQVALPVLLFANPGYEALASKRDVPAQQREASSSRRDKRGPAEGAPPVRLSLSGGTDADMAPPVGYQQHVLFPMLRKLWGLRIEDHVSLSASICLQDDVHQGPCRYIDGGSR